MTTRDEAAGLVPPRDAHYQEAIDRFGPALDRLARAYEADPDRRRDLVQDIHFAIWRSFDSYEGRCALRTWVYRVAHNTATSHITRAVRLGRQQFVALDELPAEPTDPDGDPVYSSSWTGCASGAGMTKTCQLTTVSAISAAFTGGDGWATATASGSVSGTNSVPICYTQGGLHEVGNNSPLAFFVSYGDPDGDTLTRSCVVSSKPWAFNILNCALSPANRVDVSGSGSCTTAVYGEVTLTVTDHLGASYSCYQDVKCNP